MKTFERSTSFNQWCDQPNPDGNIFQKCSFGKEVECPLLIHRISMEDKKRSKILE